uniref:Uncharacterized protein n=1 Tax=viral metagenome TaxID=1070528 RepID=A0A6M3K8J9_9ZZZZ
MSTSDDDIIPFLPEDMGEGIKNFYKSSSEAEAEALLSRSDKIREELFKNIDPKSDEEEIQILKDQLSKFTKKGGE